MKNHLRRVPLVVAARIGRTWSLYRPLDMVAFNKGEGRESWVTRLGLLVYYPTLLLAIAGAVVMWRRHARRALWVLLVPAISLTIGVAITYGQTRFRAAAEPSLAILAAVGALVVFPWIAASGAPPGSAQEPPDSGDPEARSVFSAARRWRAEGRSAIGPDSGDPEARSVFSAARALEGRGSKRHRP